LTQVARPAPGSDFFHGRREVAGFAFGHEPVARMRTVAKRLVFGHTATAKRDDLTSRQAECSPFEILDLELAFDPDGPVFQDSYLD
jgi:hypothetical protein